MDMSGKDEFSAEKRNQDSIVNYDSHPSENLISACPSPSQMMDSFGQTLWYDPTNVQTVGYGGFNGGNASSSSSFRSLEMSWNLPNLLPNVSNFLPPSMAQFPADSGFIERAARFSLFSDMVNQPLGNPESIGSLMQRQCPSNEGEHHNDASTSMKQAQPNGLRSENVSEETSSRSFGSKRRKRNRQGSEADQSQRSQQSEEELENNGDKKRNAEQTSDPAKDGYIHVRARRGQATNSHSLAERVRREKISERMKFLQDLVPGCNKVTGKAVMLDEIINYVQSLQRRVQFLSMKLATVNPQMEFNLDSLLTKDALQLRAGSSSVTPFAQNMAMTYPPLPHEFMQQTISSSMSPMNGGFKRHETNGWEGDLQNVIQINYEAGDVQPDPTVSLPGENMKVEP